MERNWSKEQQGLYNPQFEHDACGIAMLANIKGNKSHSIVSQALTALERLDHRGGRGADNRLGDGAGILTEIPHRLFQLEQEAAGEASLEKGKYGVGMLFLPQQLEARQRSEALIESTIKAEGLQVIGWRTVPTNDETLNNDAKQTQPFIRQLFIVSPFKEASDIRFERKLYQIRRKIENQLKNELEEQTYIASFSARTIIYKGLLLPEQLREFYLDLNNEAFESAFAMVHNRFSTNTFPSWRRAQPNRFSMHNGEINTINGNMHWMQAREGAFQSDVLPITEELRPVIDEDGSDSAMFDNVLEFLVLAGWSLPHAMMMMVPEPWQHNPLLTDTRKAFYQYHSMLMEPWDGPAAMAFTNGEQIGACLDRNGLRPARYILTEDDFICLSSEVGVVDIPEEKIILKDRLKPGQMLLVDIKQGRLLLDEEVKQQIFSQQPYKSLVNQQITSIDSLKAKKQQEQILDKNVLQTLQAAFGYTNEEVEKVIKPMIETGKEPIGSMGYDAPLAVLSNQSQLLFNYFKQKFAQVTNPPIDAIREELVTSMEILLGPEGNLLNPAPTDYHKIRLSTPILSDKEMGKLAYLERKRWKTSKVPILFSIAEKDGLEKAIQELMIQVDQEVEQGSKLLILTDRDITKEYAAIPSLLAVSAVHHHLIKTGKRSKVSIIIESAEPREVHHFATLLGYGANAIFPYLVHASLSQYSDGKLTEEVLTQNYVQSITKGILKIMSKMGISTVQSYTGAQIFEAVGISSEVVNQYFPRTPTQISGLTIEDIALEVKVRHERAFDGGSLETGSDFQWRKDGESHLYRPETIHTLQLACRTGKYDFYKKYSSMLYEDMNEQNALRGLLDFQYRNEPIPLDEVESVESILKRFKTGAMSYGSISKEAHEAIAIAMNRIGGKSNSGEGGEDPERFFPMENGDCKNSRIKQVASGRFGVTSYYLVNSDEIQIKMAQGAKPGEGGQLAGHKVTPEVAKTRGSTPGIELISPPPHHDIYSIEDLAQLIYDLKNANDQARINVKLVAEAGVGTIAAGVAKAKADVILISGYDGGTGAAAKSSIKHAGLPWELGLAEAHQTLILNGLREKVTLETDGKMMNGRDVVIAALLGAEEFGFSTLPLVTLGCVMMRVCHLDTCPVGIATQNPELRKKMMGTADHIVNLMHFIAQEVREYMAELGFRSLDEMIGQTKYLKRSDRGNWKSQRLDLAPLLHQQLEGNLVKDKQDHELEKNLDSRELLPLYQQSFIKDEHINAVFPIRNIDRSVGTLLGSEVSREFGEKGLAEDTIKLNFKGSAGQSFGAFIPKGISLKLEGDANDYVGKGLSGGKIIIHPSVKSNIVAEQNIIIGNAAFYGATSGEAYIKGMAGERFCVRNSGANVVVEGIGDHGCEYMTGGRVVILGDVGKNFAAGMSGGIAYILKSNESQFTKKCNQEMVVIESLDDQEELVLVKHLIDRHARYTKSRVANRILENWKFYSTQFIRVIPKEYKRVLVLEKMS
ncbi:glutamate synthase large subunit [Lederbergia graminis]|uniref:Glutamate synthase large subunit n=1 Tax=Lederbergia graminis TaxID=735518 RepID=A0ABW0LEJ0_9BACI